MQGWVSVNDPVNHAHFRDVSPFVVLANLSPKDCVLDLGTGSTWVAIEAKRRVGDSGVCVGINVCKELIEMDATSNVEAYKLERGNGGPGEAVHLIVGDFMDKAVLDKARKLLPEGKGGFDAIFLAVGPRHVDAQAARAVATPGIRFLGQGWQDRRGSWHAREGARVSRRHRVPCPEDLPATMLRGGFRCTGRP